jgi:hypothetical protein
MATECSELERIRSISTQRNRLIGEINLIEGKTADQELTAVASAFQSAQLKREAARLAAEKAFSGEPLEGVGG